MHVDTIGAQIRAFEEARRRHGFKKEADNVNGSGGIPRQGREKEYATELWLDDPTAFFLHPEGPLSDTTPDEWKAKRDQERKRKDAAELSQAQLAANVQMQASYGALHISQAAMMQQQMGLRGNQFNRGANWFPLGLFP
jgi:hypothetical protein